MAEILDIIVRWLLTPSPYYILISTVVALGFMVSSLLIIKAYLNEVHDKHFFKCALNISQVFGVWLGYTTYQRLWEWTFNSLLPFIEALVR